MKFDKKEYILKQFHFHFGCATVAGADEGGSEHTVDDKRYLAEVNTYDKYIYMYTYFK